MLYAVNCSDEQYQDRQVVSQGGFAKSPKRPILIGQSPPKHWETIGEIVAWSCACLNESLRTSLGVELSDLFIGSW